MTFDISVLIDQMKIIATLMVIGIIWQKSKLLNDTLIDSLSAIIAKLVLPLMLCTIIGSVSKDELSKGGILLAASVLYYVSIIIIAILLSKISKKDPAKRKLDILLRSFGNSGFIGIPLIVSIFADSAGLISAIYTIVEVLVFWIIGPIILGDKKIDLKKLVTPITCAVFIGCIIMLLPIDLSENLVWQTAKNVGSTCKYFASIYIGLAVARMDLSRLRANLNSCFAIPVKLIIAPILVYLLVGETGLLSGENLTMILILAATPTGMMVPLVAEFSGYGREHIEYVSVGLMICTVCCLFTMPLIIWIINLI